MATPNSLKSTVSSAKPTASWHVKTRVWVARCLLRSARWLALIIAPELANEPTETDQETEK